MKHVVVLGLAVGLFCNSVNAGSKTPAELVALLQDGGQVIYIRHASTESDYADQITADTQNCSTQRVLSEKGWAQAKSIGSNIRKLNIPVGSVTSSEYCRAWQTADLAFGTYTKSADLNFEKAETYSDEQTNAMRERLVPMLNAKPDSGQNTVIVGHDDPFEAATGIYPEPQGVSYVITPHGDGTFEVMGAIPSDAWPD